MSRVAVITGANQGLGFALAEGLAQQLAEDDIVYLTGRNARRVARAKARVAGARAGVRPYVLDVRDAEAIDAFTDELQAVHGGIDIVFSNHYQRVMPEDRPRDVIAKYVDTNNLGTTRILRALAPLLRPRGRLFVVASSLGALSHLPQELHDRFDTDAMTLDDVDRAILEWQDAVLENRAGGEGWPDFINIPSKVGQVAALRVLARDRAEADAHQNILIAAVCPGMIDTPASRPWFDMSAAQTPGQAAVALLRLALDPQVDARFYGELVRFGEIVPWVDTVGVDSRVAGK